MEKLIIDRAKWLHGEGAEKSYLLRPSDEKMCCLGFLAISRGATCEQISGVQGPARLFQEKAIRLAGLVIHEYRSTVTAYGLMSENDFQRGDDESREAEIARLFREIDVAVEFVGSYS